MKKNILLACLLLLITTDVFSAVIFIPRVTIREEYSDNLDLTPDNEKSDWITSISPGAMLEFSGRTSGLFLDYEPSLVMYSRYSGYDTWRHRGQVGLWADFSRHTHFEADNVSIYTEEPISEYDTTLRRNRNHYFVNTTSTELSYQFGPEDHLDLGYSYEFLDNEDDGIDDTKRHEPYILLTYWPIANEWGTETSLRYRKGLYEREDDFDFWTAGLRLIRRFTRSIEGTFRYTFSQMEYDGETEGYQLHEAGPGFLYEIDEDTSLSIEFVYLYRDREISDDDSEFLFISEIVKRWIIYRNYMELTVRSGYRPDTFGAENNGFNIFAEGDARYIYSFSRQAHGDIYGGVRYDNYIDSEPEDRIDNTLRAGAGFSYQALSWLSLRIEYGYRQLFSEIYEYEYAENRVALTLTMMPLRGHQSPRIRPGSSRDQSLQRDSEQSDVDSSN